MTLGAPSIGTAYVYTPWTEAEEQFLVDTYSTLTAKAQAVQLSRQLADVVAKRGRMGAKGRFDGLRRAYHPPWTREEEDWLRDNYHQYTIKTLVRKLQRSRVAITLRVKRLNIRRTDGYYTARAVAEIFGGDPKRVAALYHEGYLKGRKAPYLQGKNYPWMFTELAIVRFIKAYPWLLRPEAMQQEHYFRSVLRQEWERDPWYDSRQAAAMMGVGDETILRRLRSGEIPAFQRSPSKPWFRWWIRRSDLLTQFRRHDTPEERARNMADMQRARRERSGLPRQLHAVWEIVCQDCAERYQIKAPPRVWSTHVLKLAGEQHVCAQAEQAADLGGTMGMNSSNEVQVLGEKVDQLRAALIAHRLDLHGYSTRPCATCRQSAEALGIENIAPDSCANRLVDLKAFRAGGWIGGSTPA